MRAPLFVLPVAVGLIACAIGAAADVPATSTQTAAWTHRKVHLDFGYAPLVTAESAPWQEASCDKLFAEVKVVLVQLGARPSDVDSDQRGCYGSVDARSDDVRFSVLAPGNSAEEPVEARWQTAELKGNCDMIAYVTGKVLPLMTARNVQRISKADCERDGVALRAEVLMPTQRPEDWR